MGDVILVDTRPFFETEPEWIGTTRLMPHSYRAYGAWIARHWQPPASLLWLAGSWGRRTVEGFRSERPDVQVTAVIKTGSVGLLPNALHLWREWEADAVVLQFGVDTIVKGRDYVQTVAKVAERTRRPVYVLTVPPLPGRKPAVVAVNTALHDLGMQSLPRQRTGPAVREPSRSTAAGAAGT